MQILFVACLVNAWKVDLENKTIFFSLTFWPFGCILPILAFNLPFSKKVGVVQKESYL